MKMLKIGALLTALLLTASCSAGEPDAAGASGEYILATGSATGTYYSLGSTMAALWQEHLPGVTVTPESTAGSKENLRLIADGGADIAIVQGDILWYAQSGTELFKGDKLSGISVLSSLYKEMIQVVVPASSPAVSIADLAGKTVSVGASGSGNEAAARRILAAYGLTYDDITVKYQSFSDCASGIKNGTVDAAFVTAGVPSAAVLQLSEQTKIRLLPITGEAASKLKSECGFYISCSVPREAYGTTRDCSTLGICALLVGRSSLADAEARELTAALYDNLAELGAAHAKGGEISLSGAGDGVFSPLHPGAESYFAGDASEAE